MMTLRELVAAFDAYLDVAGAADYGPNGLQVEGRAAVRKLVFGVSACQALFDAALAAEADAIVVHHGLLWGDGGAPIRGAHARRLRTLLANEISLLAYHLPLDRHPEVGTAAVLARRLGWQALRPFGDYRGRPLGWFGEVVEGDVHAAADAVRRATGCPTPLVFPFGPARVQRAALVTGAGQRELRLAIEERADLFVTGEVSEFVMNLAREEGIHFIAAGHYFTERPGVEALADWARTALALDATFVDVPNPV